jgi:hypothetical protein
MQNTTPARLFLTCLLGFSFGTTTVHAADSDNKFSTKAKVKLEQKIGENGKVGIGIDSNDKREATIGYGPVTEKVTSDGVELEVAAGPKFGSTQLKAKATLQGGVDRSEDKTIYKDGVPSLKVSGSVGLEASAGAGPVKGSVSASKSVFSTKVNLIDFDAENARHTKALKAADAEADDNAFAAQSEKKPTPSQYSRPEKNGMKPEERMAEMERADAEKRRLGAALTGQKVISGYAIYKRPANIPEEDWKAIIDSVVPVYRATLKIGGNQMSVRLDNFAEADWNALAASNPDWVFQPDAKP